MAFLTSNYYRILSPVATHRVLATCEEVECANYANGWRVPLSVMTERHFADLKAGGWHYAIVRLGDDLGYVEFEAGQKCFTEHTKPLEREPLWFRNNYRHSGVDAWHDDFATNQDRLKRLIERG